MINSFKGSYKSFSNFCDAPVEFEGLFYPNNEAAFQSAKLKDIKDRIIFTGLDPSNAKKMGRKVKLREDWEDIKEDIMYRICLDKFRRNKKILTKLLNTGDKILIEGNTWHDNTWGDCYCERCKHIEGKNLLGKILMRVREELKNIKYL